MGKRTWSNRECGPRSIFHDCKVRDMGPNSVHAPIDASELVSLDVVRVRLGRVWLIGAGVILILLVIQSLLHVYGDLTQEAWGWFLPTIMPTLGMIITVWTYTALDPLSSGSVVRRAFVQIAVWLSVIYLVLVLLTIVMQPFGARTAADRVGLMRTSNLWLGPVQGLVASALGVLFVSKQKKVGP
jgi:hypothetical protein